jgi:hypothetical protein
MMVHVIDERNPEPLARRQQILDGVDAVIVLEHDPIPRARRQPHESRFEPCECSFLPALRAPAVNRQLLGADQLRNFRLVFELSQGRRDDRGIHRTRHDELIGVKAEPDVTARLPDGGERLAHLGIELVQMIGMRVQRKQARLDAKCSDALIAAPANRRAERSRVVKSELVEKFRPRLLRKRRDVTRGRRAESNRLLEKCTAQTQTQRHRRAPSLQSCAHVTRASSWRPIGMPTVSRPV